MSAAHESSCSLSLGESIRADERHSAHAGGGGGPGPTCRLGSDAWQAGGMGPCRPPPNKHPATTHPAHTINTLHAPTPSLFWRLAISPITNNFWRCWTPIKHNHHCRKGTVRKPSGVGWWSPLYTFTLTQWLFVHRWTLKPIETFWVVYGYWILGSSSDHTNLFDAPYKMTDDK